MPEGNGNQEWRDDMQRRIQALQDARREVEDSLIVMAQLEARLSRGLRETAEWVASHDALIKRMEIQNAEMNDKINFIIDREMRREGGPEIR
jgi:hypothetical protein